MTGVALLCEMIAQGGMASATFHHDNPAFPALIRYKYLIEVGVVSSLVCTNCDEHHAAQVVFENGCYGHHCPSLGFVPLSREDVQAVQPNVPLLIDRLAETFDCSKRKSSTIYGKTWRIGAVKVDGGEVIIYFHPRLQNEEDARDLEQALNREVRSPWRLVVTAMGTLPLAGLQAVQLFDLAELDVEQGVMRILAQPADLAGVPRKNTGGRPSDYGPALAEIIAGRIMSGEARYGINAEARAVLTDFKDRHHDTLSPSLSTVKRHIEKSKGGS